MSAGGSQELSGRCPGWHRDDMLVSVPFEGPWVPEGWWVWEVWDPLHDLSKLCW